MWRKRSNAALDCGATTRPISGYGGRRLRTLATRVGTVFFGLAFVVATHAGAADVGQIKVARGEVRVLREGQSQPGAIGTRLRSADTVTTGADGSVGIAMDDDTLLSAGPNSFLSLDRYSFDETAGKGQFDASLPRGSLSVISGRIAKGAPEAIKIRTPVATFAVRGTEFVVEVKE